MSDDYDLQRFVTAQEPVYGTVLAELRSGAKRTHWMWFIFPQIAGLGSSSMARHFAIRSLDEARAYDRHPLLGLRLRDCFRLVMSSGRAITDIFPYPDDLKYCSSATLFAAVSPAEPLYAESLARGCNGLADTQTLRLLGPPAT